MIDRIGGINNTNQNIQKQTTKNTDLNFSDILKDAIDDVNNLQKDATKASTDYAAGKITDIHQVMIAAEKASLSLKLTTEVTNKIVDAYKEIMRMQL